MRGVSWLAENLLASQEGICSTKLVNLSICQLVRVIYFEGQQDPLDSGSGHGKSSSAFRGQKKYK